MSKNNYYIILSIIIFVLFILLFYFNQRIEAKSNNLILINEIMYIPEESDYYNEWIELYNPTSFPIDVKNWTIYDGIEKDFIIKDTDHGDGSTIIPPGDHAIITDHGTKVYENFNVSKNCTRLYVDDSAICGYGLNNDKEKLILLDTSGNIVDSVEWGYDFLEVPGLPADSVNKGNTLARYNLHDSNNSLIDFYYGITPTPGKRNKVDFDIEVYPRYVPKIQKNKEYSVPFALKIFLKKVDSNESYQLKTFIQGNFSNISLATQTWNGVCWKYSNEYTSTITMDTRGNWSGWQLLRFKKDYQEYKKNIENNKEAYLTVKIKKDDILYKVVKKIFLLDMDKSSSSGYEGGYVVGIAKKYQELLINKTVIIENRIGEITGIYFTEDNGIEDGLISKPGYYKISSLVGSGYNLKIFNDTNLIRSLSNIDIKQGNYGVRLKCPDTCYQLRKKEKLDIPIIVKNIGDFSDFFTTKIKYISDGWIGSLDKNNIFLNPGEMAIVKLHIYSYNMTGNQNGNISIYTNSSKDVGESDEIILFFDIVAPDLTITNLTCFDSTNQKNTLIGEGETVSIKAAVKNIGNQNATSVNVSFYYDFKYFDRLIGKKYYYSISKYQKYPSVKWDTTDLEEGNYTIIVVVDESNFIDELEESNNEYSMQVEIYRTSPIKDLKNIVISELYYHTHPKINNEYIAIYNPTNKELNISGWYLTNTPWKTVKEQTKIIFPESTILPSKDCLYITQNATAYHKETVKNPNFEYTDDSTKNIPQMMTYKTLRLSNKGGSVALKDLYNHTVDIILYGNSSYKYDEWRGLPVNNSGVGVVLKRNRNKNGIIIDTNTSEDWNNLRRYGIGQSDFPYQQLLVYGSIKTFVSPDCSFKTMVDELRNATESIYFNIYEFTNPFLCDELVAALNRNVSVNIFLEGSPIGGIDQREKLILNRIKSNGGKIRFIVNDPEYEVYARYTFDHGKYLVIDNKTVIVESCNWAKTGIPIDPTFGNREWGIVVRNEDVADYFLTVFFDDWNPQRCDSCSIGDIDLSIPSDYFIDRSIYKGNYEPIFRSKEIIGNFTATPVFSPDTSIKSICNLIDTAKNSIFIEQLYIYKDWENRISPIVKKLIDKANQGVDIRIILNYNPDYTATNEKCNQTKKYLEEYGLKVKFHYTNWSYFANIHNKGMIVDNRSVLIASINWNENSFTRNREAGIIIENEEIASYYADVFIYDWELNPPQIEGSIPPLADYKNQFLIVLIYIFTLAIIIRDWRKRKWTL